MTDKSNSRSQVAFPLVLTLALLVAAVLPAAASAFAGPNTLGWVGNMYPVGGSSNSITAGGNFDVYVQVYKGGVTPGGGQGANITCTLYWGQVVSFGGSWSNVTSTAMNYHGEVGNNDEYKGTIAPPAGLYEFTAFCTDTIDNQSLWQQAGNGRLTVNAPAGPHTRRSQGPLAGHEHHRLERGRWLELQAALRPRRRDHGRSRSDGLHLPRTGRALLREPHRQRHSQRLPQEPQRDRADPADHRPVGG